MVIITHNTITAFIKIHSDAAEALIRWYDIVRIAN